MVNVTYHFCVVITAFMSINPRFLYMSALICIQNQHIFLQRTAYKTPDDFKYRPTKIARR